MGMDDATWKRHANPWSGWSRITILPLLCLAIMSRVWVDSVEELASNDGEVVGEVSA